MIDFNNKKKLKFDSSKDKIFFTADTHWRHENIIKYCNRPFSSIEEHDKTLIERWNEIIPEDGIVFHLGDFAFASEQYIKDILEQLNGKKYLIFGNHDWKRMTKYVCTHYFEDVSQQMIIRIDDKIIYLNHFPFLCFSGSWRGLDASWQIFGHVHSGPNSTSGLDYNRLTNLFPTQFDCGVDHNNYYPYSFEEIKTIIEDQMMSLNLYRK